jgi:PAS domain S-box-containing protein
MRSLRRDLQFTFIFTSLIPLVVFGIASGLLNFFSLRSLSERNNQLVLNNFESQINQKISSYETQLELLKRYLIRDNFAQDEFAVSARYLLESEENVDRIIVLDSEGGGLLSYPKVNWFKGSDYSRWDYFQRADPGRYFWSKMQLSTSDTIPKVTLSQKVRDKVLALNINLIALFTSIQSSELVGDSYFAIMDSSGQFISHTDEKSVLSNGFERQYPLILELMSEGKNDLVVVEDDKSFLARFNRIEQTEWILGIYQDQEVFTQPLFNSLMFLLVILILALVVALIMASIQSSKFISSLQNLNVFAEEISQGNYSAVSTKSDYLEIEDFGEKLEKMLGEIKEREKQITYQNDFLARIIESLTHPFYVIDSRTYKVEMVNSAGRGSNRGIGEYCYKLIEDRGGQCDFPGHVCPLEMVKKTKGSFHTEHTQMGPSGELRITEIHAYPVFDDNNEVDKVIEYSLDITKRRKNENKLQEAQELVQAVLNSMSSVLLAVDTRGKILHWNHNAEEYFEMSGDQLVDQNWTKVFYDSDFPLEEISEALKAQKQITRTIENQKEGNRVVEELTFYPMDLAKVKGGVIKVEDFTKRVMMEELMVQSEKMLTIGGLAAGVAHEINNPLAGILQSAELLERRLFKLSKMNQATLEKAEISWKGLQDYLEHRKINETLNSISESGRRAAKIISELLSFSRKGGGDKKPEDVLSLVEETLSLASSDYQLKKRYDFRSITLEKDFQDYLSPVLCDKTQIQQVLFNIFKNSAQAFDSSTQESPTISINIKEENGAVHVSIKDNGPGMDEETKSKIFEPFFTTKETGEGTGLGMYVSYFIVKEVHSGELSVHSEKGKGTSITMTLPVSVDS